MATVLTATVLIIEEASIPAPGNAAALESVVMHALSAEGCTDDWEISIALMGDDGLRRLHRDFLADDTSTDIMTFPLGDRPGGDIAISVERAVEQAPEFGLTGWEEVCFLAVHGVLHLNGWNDGDDRTRMAMLDRQSEILATWSAG